MNVTCDPRGTVSVCGQTALLTMRMVRVSGSVVHVSPGVGVVVLDVFPHAPDAMTIARPAAAASPAGTLIDVTRRS